MRLSEALEILTRTHAPDHSEMGYQIIMTVPTNDPPDVYAKAWHVVRDKVDRRRARRNRWPWLYRWLGHTDYWIWRLKAHPGRKA